MKSITIHPLSLVLGAGLVVLAGLTMAQSPQPAQPRAQSADVAFVARPRDFVQIAEGTPFVVPPGKLFVPTAIGVRDFPNPHSGIPMLAFMNVDGHDEFVSVASEKSYTAMDAVSAGTSMQRIPAGFAVQPDSTVSVRDQDPGDQQARLWGYLADI